jgi:hypothetical protein
MKVKWHRTCMSCDVVRTGVWPAAVFYGCDGEGKAMKVVIFGLTVSSSWGNGHATIWRALCRALARRGYRVVFFERDVPYYAAHRDLTELPGGQLCLYTDWMEAVSLGRRHLADADVGMVTSYCPDGIAAADLVLSSPTPLRAFL